MDTLEGRNVVITGGTRGLGLGIVEALAEHRANVTAVARNAELLADAKKRFGIATRVGDIVDERVAHDVLAETRPEVLLLVAGATPPHAPLHQLTWDEFRGPWETDAKSTFHWLQHALKLPLAKGSRVIVFSSGAAVQGSPRSGGYAGAKRMQWLMARYANNVSQQLKLDLRFQVIVPQQIMPTDLGMSAARDYAGARGVSTDEFFAGFGKPLTPRAIGDYVVSMLIDQKYREIEVLGVKGDTGLVPLAG